MNAHAGRATDRQVTDLIGQVLQAFPDLDVEIENEVAEGDSRSAPTAPRSTGVDCLGDVGVLDNAPGELIVC
jgi:hypothetical protein